PRWKPAPSRTPSCAGPPGRFLAEMTVEWEFAAWLVPARPTRAGTTATSRAKGRAVQRGDMRANRICTFASFPVGPGGTRPGPGRHVPQEGAGRRGPPPAL